MVLSVQLSTWFSGRIYNGGRKLSNYSAVYTSSTACLPQCQKCEDTYFKNVCYISLLATHDLLCECMADTQEPNEKQLKELSLFVSMLLMIDSNK